MLEIRAAPYLPAEELVALFRRLVDSGATHFFHPHELNPEAAERLARYRGKDLYFALMIQDKAQGYGMLRGWDDGYDVPSLGIALLPAFRGIGLGFMFMQFLHSAARLRGVKQIRLTVDVENTRAIKLYESLGYTLRPMEDGRLVGFLTT